MRKNRNIHVNGTEWQFLPKNSARVQGILTVWKMLRAKYKDGLARTGVVLGH